MGEDRPTGDPIPRLYEGRAAALLASGPSLCQADVDSCVSAGFVLFGCNDQYKFGVDVLYAPDLPWIIHHREKIKQSCRYTCNVDAAKRYGWHFIRVRDGMGEGISTDPTSLMSGGNAGYQLVNLAVLMGVTKIVLLGYDMRHVNGQTHWFGDHSPQVTGATENPGKYVKWARHFLSMRGQLNDIGVEVINCTADSAITAFPSKPLAEALL